jgi:peroxiredoxin
MRSDDLLSPPDDLPVPVDDGACDHLRGAAVPTVALTATDGTRVRLDQSSSRWTVVYAYPRTGAPDGETPPGWNDIPGARGCTPQNCAYRDHHVELRALGATVYGLSTQSTEYQQEMVQRLHLPYPVLSDASFELTRALKLPTFDFDAVTLLKRFAVVIEAGRIVHVIYPVFPSSSDAPQIVTWLGQA